MIKAAIVQASSQPKIFPKAAPAVQVASRPKRVHIKRGQRPAPDSAMQMMKRVPAGRRDMKMLSIAKSKDAEKNINPPILFAIRVASPLKRVTKRTVIPCGV